MSRTAIRPERLGAEAPPLLPQRDPCPHPARWAGAQADLRAALPGWLCARAVVLAALALSRFLVTRLHIPDAAARVHSHEGLMAWDAGFYRGIAVHGYGFGAVHLEALRFFPLVPLLARGGGVVLGGRPALALVVVANVSALAAAAALHRLALVETGDRRLASRAAWLVALAPPAYVLVLGYAEATFMALAVVCMLGLRQRRWMLATAAGALAALTRPVGLLLVAPAMVELWRAWRSLGGQGRRLRAMVPAGAAVVGPLAGLGAYLAWVGVAYHDWLLPFSVQQQGRLRGPSVDPLTALAHEGRGLLRGEHVGSGLHVVWTLLFVALLVVIARRWPASYTALAAATLLVGLGSRNLDSLERYMFSCFPFVLAAATLTRAPRWERGVLVLSGVTLSSYALLSFLGAVVP